jgi:Prephenate dehydratase
MLFRKSLKNLFSTGERTKAIKSVILSTTNNQPGHLKEILEIFANMDLNLTHIESLPASTLDHLKGNSFVINFEYTDKNIVKKALSLLSSQGIVVNETTEKQVPWFPRNFQELDEVERKTMAAGVELESDHPGFHDEMYKKRREEIAEIAKNYKFSDSFVPVANYTSTENET